MKARSKDEKKAVRKMIFRTAPIRSISYYLAGAVNISILCFVCTDLE